MSFQEIERFNRETRGSEDQTRDVIRSGQSLESIVQLANDRGYSFTLAEVQEYVRSKATEKLSEANLAEIAAAGAHKTTATKKGPIHKAGSTVTTTVTAVTTAAVANTAAVQTVAAATTVAAAAEAVVAAVVVLT